MYFTTLNVGIAERNAAHPPFAICSVFGKLFDSLFHSIRIGAEILPSGACAENWDWEYKQQGNNRYFFPHVAILQVGKVK